jgi:hypothetical protein
LAKSAKLTQLDWGLIVHKRFLKDSSLYCAWQKPVNLLLKGSVMSATLKSEMSIGEHIMCVLLLSLLFGVAGFCVKELCQQYDGTISSLFSTNDSDCLM